MDEWVRKMYKSTSGFGDNNPENRRGIANERRRTNRDSALNKRRNIPLNLSPMTPKHTETIPEEPPKKINNRLEMLKKWKQEKEKKKLEQRKQQKPMFKWSKVDHKDDLSTALDYIKGKKISKEKSKNESIRPIISKREIPSTSKLSSKKTVSSIPTYSGTKKTIREEIPLPGTSGVGLKRSQQTTTFKNASGSVKITQKPNQNIHEPKTSARQLKYPVNKSLISKDSGIPIVETAAVGKLVQMFNKNESVSKRLKTPKNFSVKSAHVNGSEENINATSSSANRSRRNLNSFSEEFVENVNNKSEKKVKTPKKSKDSKVLNEAETGMNATFDYATGRSGRNLHNFSEDFVENFSTSNSLNVSKPSKKVKTPKKSLKNSTSNLNVAEKNAGIHTTSSSASRRSKRNLNSFSEELVENVNKSEKKMKTPKKSEDSQVLNETETGMNATERSSRNLHNFSEDFVENFSTSNSLNVSKSWKKVKTPKKSLKNSTSNLNVAEESAGIHTISSSASRRSKRNLNSFSEELFENFSKNAAPKANTPRQSLNNLKTSTPNGIEDVASIKTPRSSTTKKSNRNSKIHDDEARMEENSAVLRTSILDTPNTDWKLIENDSFEASSTKPRSRRKNLARENCVTPNQSEENQIIGNSPRSMSTSMLKNDSVSTPNLSVSQGNVLQLKTPRSSAIRNSRIHGAVNVEAGTPRKSMNTPKIAENENSKKPMSLRKSLAIKMSHLTVASPRIISPRNSTIKIKTPSSTRRKSRIHTAEVNEKENATPNPEWKITENDSAEKSRSLRKSLTIKNYSAISTPKRDDDNKIKPRRSRNVKETVELDNNLQVSSLSVPLKSDGSNYFTPIKSPSETLDDVFITPEKGAEVVYVSPFVTTSRGKSQARQEFKMRKSTGACNTSFSSNDNAKSPRAAAAYFTRILEAEIEKLREKCNTWDVYKNSGDLSEDACGLIDMTIGQTNLLISKKFNQFRGLIEKCRTNNESEMRIQCEDLHGFWDMIYKQVNDLNKRFSNLQDMKDNNWLEEAPKKKTPKKTASKKKKRIKSAPVTSSLKETILAARKKMVKSSSQDVEICILDEAPKNSQMDSSTPGRGILKSQNTKSEKRKTVVFKDVKSRTSKSANKNTPNQPMRRSLRLTLSATKLNFE